MTNLVALPRQIPSWQHHRSEHGRPVRTCTPPRVARHHARRYRTPRRTPRMRGPHTGSSCNGLRLSQSVQETVHRCHGRGLIRAGRRTHAQEGGLEPRNHLTVRLWQRGHIAHVNCRRLLHVALVRHHFPVVSCPAAQVTASVYCAHRAGAAGQNFLGSVLRHTSRGDRSVDLESETIHPARAAHGSPSGQA